jgi:hypothetical protein
MWRPHRENNKGKSLQDISVACWLSNFETFFRGSEKGISVEIKPSISDSSEVEIHEVFVVDKRPKQYRLSKTCF